MRARSNVLLVELLVVIVFFALSAAVMLNLFVTAHEKSVHATLQNEALADAEDWAETLAASDAPEEELYGAGWSAGQNGYALTRKGYTLRADVEKDVRSAGVLYKITLSAEADAGGTVARIRADRYVAEVFP